MRPLLSQFESYWLGYWVSRDKGQCFHITTEGYEKLANCDEALISGALCSNLTNIYKLFFAPL